nr:hypothetical protein [uncultured Rhodopila sp.]
MLDAAWKFLTDPTNRDTLGWIGAGIAAGAAGLWAVVTFLVRKEGSDPRPNVSADRGGVAIGGSATNSPINVNPPRPGKH